MHEWDLPQGAFLSTKNFETEPNGTNIPLSKFPEKPEIFEFLKTKPANRKFREESQIEKNSR